jgi:hypothetical protein
MFLKRIVSLAAATALAAGGFLAAAPGASADTPANLDNIIACMKQIAPPHDDLFWASWNSSGGAPYKQDVLGHIAAARPLVAKIKCTDELHPRIAENLAIITAGLDSGVKNINKGDWKAAREALSHGYMYYVRMQTAFDDLIYG